MPKVIQVSSNENLKNKIVDHGCDLLNRHELSVSQNKELQRFIDANAHLLGIHDKESDGNLTTNNKKTSDYSQPYHGHKSEYLGHQRSTSTNRLNSPASEYGTGKRKEVSWSDKVRAKSYSPTKIEHNNRIPTNHRSSNDTMPVSNDDFQTQTSPWQKPYISPLGSRDDLNAGAKFTTRGLRDRENSPAYSNLQKHPDDYNRYETKKYIDRENQKYQLDDTARFYGYGDRIGSGIELTPKRWTGGETIMDPTFVKKSLKPRRMYYSPIGDGVVDADGIEMKRGPKDMNTRRYITHEHYAEKGRNGHDGLRLFETRWNEDGDAKPANRQGNLGNDTDPKMDFKMPHKGQKFPNTLTDYELEPTLNSDHLLSGRNSALSVDTNGNPRHGWTKTFIVNPRELINQYGTETLTSIFDLEDHTPKTITTTTETIVEPSVLEF